MASRFIASALAVAGLAAAQCSISGTTTISNAAQATAITCSTFTGSIAIATGTTDQIQFGNIQRIHGSLIANNAAKLTSLAAESLQTIDDAFTLMDCSSLSNLNFPQLTNVNAINWVGLASLQGLSFSTGVQYAETVSIENTKLASLDGIDLKMVGAMRLENNNFLQSINMQLSNISETLIVSSNGRNVDLSLPNLITANTLNIHNVSSIDLSSLSSVNGSFGFYSNFVDALLAPNLTYIGSELAVDANAALTTVSFPELKTIIGGFEVQNNTDLKNLTGFPKVANVGGAVSLFGVFDSVPLPALNEVRGAFYIESSSDSSTLKTQCSHYNSIHGSNSVIQGSGFICNPNVNGASTKGKGSTTSGGSSPSGSASASATTSKSSANTLLVSGTTGVLGVVAAMFGML